jgi:hypothetical protein
VGGSFGKLIFVPFADFIRVSSRLPPVSIRPTPVRQVPWRIFLKLYRELRGQRIPHHFDKVRRSDNHLKRQGCKEGRVH